MLLNGASSRARTAGIGSIDPAATSDGTDPARTIAAVIRRPSGGRVDEVAGLVDTGGQTVFGLAITSAGNLGAEWANGLNALEDEALGAGAMYVAVDKATGATRPRAHYQRYGTDGAVVHANTEPSGATWLGPATLGSVAVGAYGTGSGWAGWTEGDIYIVGIWDRQLSDGEHETLAAGPLSAWLGLEPDWIVADVGYGPIGSQIDDLSGGDAHLTTLVNIARSESGYPFSEPSTESVRVDGAWLASPGRVRVGGEWV